MNTYAIIKNGVVENLILWDGNTKNWQPPTGTTAVPVSSGTFVTIGSLYNGTVFSDPPAAS